MSCSLSWVADDVGLNSQVAVLMVTKTYSRTLDLSLHFAHNFAVEVNGMWTHMTPDNSTKTCSTLMSENNQKYMGTKASKDFQ